MDFDKRLEKAIERRAQMSTRGAGPEAAEQQAINEEELKRLALAVPAATFRAH